MAWDTAAAGPKLPHNPRPNLDPRPHPHPNSNPNFKPNLTINQSSEP